MFLLFILFFLQTSMITVVNIKHYIQERLGVSYNHISTENFHFQQHNQHLLIYTLLFYQRNLFLIK